MPGSVGDDAPRLFLVPGGASVDGALDGNLSETRTPKWTFGNENWKNSRKICAATRSGDVYVFFRKESGSIYRVGRVLRLDPWDPTWANGGTVVTFSRVVPVVGCGYEEIARLCAERTAEKSYALLLKGREATELAQAIIKALDSLEDRQHMKLGRTVNRLLVESLDRTQVENERLATLVKEREDFDVLKKENERLKRENERLKRRLRVAEHRLRLKEITEKESRNSLGQRTAQLGVAKKALRRMSETALSIIENTEEGIIT